MKKLIIIVFCSCFFSSYAQQVVVACQVSDANGYIYQNGKWKRSGFVVDKPFFLKISADGLIEPSSLSGVGMSYGVSCRNPWMHLRDTIICNDSVDQLVVNTTTLEGAIARFSGAAGSGSVRDTLSVSVFQCQKM